MRKLEPQPDDHDDTPPASAELRLLPGDELIKDARKQLTHTITIGATPDAIWPWLVSMTRAGGTEGHAVLRSDAPRSLVLGGLYDHATRHYLPFDAPRPAEFWHATWALVLTPLGPAQTRLDVRSRVAFTFEAVKWASVWTHPFHDFAEPEQLDHLKRAAEGHR